MTDRRTLQFASQGFRTQEIAIAPDVMEETVSKRQPLIREEDAMLDLNITELDIGTKARNRAFQERLDEIWRDTMAYESKLKAEAKQAAETILNMREDYAKHINEFKNSILSKVNTTYDKVDNEGIPEQSARVDVIEKDLEFFIKTTVPDAIEKQSGEVSRQLKRLYENFGIEQEKERKRETKLVGKANAHLTNTAQRFMDENALMSSCFFTLEDDIVEHEQRAARMHLLRNSAAFEKVKKLNAVAKLEAVTRTEEDVDVLSTVIETQQLLQQTVLMHFGTKADEIDFSDLDFPVMEKLDRRMSKIKQKEVAAAIAAQQATEDENKSKS